MNKTLVYLFLSIIVAGPFSVYATHNRAGEIIYRQISQLKYHIEIITYTEINNSNVDRPVLGIDYGDGSPIDSIKRDPSRTVRGFMGFVDIQKNVYVTTHTFPGPGDYDLAMEDPNRNGGVLNIPSSIEQSFSLVSTLRIYPNRPNNSPDLQYPPIAVACLNYPFIYNPGAVDIDLDSLSYSLVPCRGANGLPINGYTLPDASKFFSIDPVTGTITWDSPTAVGEYNIAILITEYRRGLTGNGQIAVFEVGSILRDMQITVQTGCSNRPPSIEQKEEYCVLAGNTLTFSVVASDTLDGSGNKLTMQAVGAPFQVPPIATFTFNGTDPVTGLFNWTTDCSHVRKEHYTVNCRATDDGKPPLSNYMITKIRVVAPPVENVVATPKSSSIELTWDKEICSQAIGYKIYRRPGESGFVPDSCQTGVPNDIGYELIYEGTDVNQLSYLDNDNGQGLIPGELYCYLIVAYFLDEAESYASAEVCTKLNKDVPILTNVDVRHTDAENGSIGLIWSKPTEHDVTVYPGPYKYRIWRTTDRKQNNFFILDSLFGINDTMYTDTLLNTFSNEYMYKIEILDFSTQQNVSMGFSVGGTSVYLNTVPKDNELTLYWNEKVPWRNMQYVVYKQNASGTFDSLATTTDRKYRDTGLTNLSTYCYYVKSSGEYSLSSIAKPLINRSQIHCGIPEDLQAPCPPILRLSVEDCAEVEEILLQNPEKCGEFNLNDQGRVDNVHLEWTNPNKTCDTTDDVLEYKIFFSNTYDGNYYLWKDRIDVNTTSADKQEYNSRAGCYFIVAIDSFGNHSPVIDTVCADNCLIYKLPNVVTPNGDGINDLFRPFPYCFVESVECRIYSRWGNQVFQTTDPDILWDGTNQAENKPVAEGVYFYTCIVNHISVYGTRKTELRGVVHVLGSGNTREN